MSALNWLKLATIRTHLRHLALTLLAAVVWFGLPADGVLAAPPVAMASSCSDSLTQAVGPVLGGNLAHIPELPVAENYGVAEADLLLDHLIAQGHLSSDQVKRFKAEGDYKSIVTLLEHEIISESQFELLMETYALLVGEQSGPSVMVKLLPRVKNGKVRPSRELILWTADSLAADKSLVLSDPLSGKSLGVIDYQFKAGIMAVLEIHSIEVLRSVRGQGYSDLLVERLIDIEPQARMLTGELARTNLAVLNEWLDDGYSLDEAFAETPLYKSVSKVGFTKVSVHATSEKIEFEVSRP